MNRSARLRHALVSVVILAGFAFLAQAARAGQESAYKKAVTIEGITEYQMENGVRFLLFPDPSAPTVTVNLTVLVGSRHEGYGETGMAHLLEHMLFKGCKQFPEPWKALEDHGARFNGTTWVDRTNYYETMPATDKNLEFGIKLEADRLVNSFIRREDLAKEMTVVRNEFEQGENNSESILRQRMMAVAYEWHNYGKSTIGNRSDIERVPIERLQAFYRKYYQPDNVVLMVSGRFDEKKALGYISKYFGALKRPGRSLENTYTDEPAQDGERTVTLRRVGKVAMVGLMYHIPAATHADNAAMDILSEVLTNDPSGRLYKALVETKKATSVSSGANSWHDPGVLEIFATVADTSTPEEVRDIMLDVVESFAKKPAGKEEVDRAKQTYKSFWERSLADSRSIAIRLSEWAGAGDWRLMFIHRDRQAEVTAADVDRVAASYLKRSNRTLGVYVPTTKVARAQIPSGPDVIDLVKDYKGGKGVSAGEIFDPTPANIEKRVKRLELPGGLKIALLPKKTRGETVVGQLVLHFGNEKSLFDYITASDFLGPLMMRGTKKHSYQEIEDLLNKLSATLNAGSTTGSLSFSLKAKRSTLPGLLEILGEVLREPSFPGKEFEILKRATKQDLEKALTNPQALAATSMRRQLNPYPKDDIRYQPTIQESLERLEKTTPEQVARLYAEQVGGQTGELVLVGDFDADAVVKQIEAIASGWKAKVPFQRITKSAVLTTRGSREDIVVPDKEGAILVAGEVLAISDTDPAYPALTLGNYILGGSGTSRLFDRLRQKEGLSYGAGSFLSASSQDKYGAFVFYAICNPKAIDEADQAAIEVVTRTLKDGVTEKELVNAQKSYLQERKVARASDNNVAATLREGLYLGRTYAWWGELEEKISALTAAEVNRALAAQLSVNRLVIRRAGDFKKK
jgi:zinc protease